MHLRAFYLKSWKNYKPWMELFYIFCWCVAGFVFSANYDLLEKFENEVLDDINTNAENFIKSIKDIDFLGEDFSNEIKPFINKIFTYIKENYIIMKVILGPKSDMRFQNKIKKALNILLTEKGWDNYFDSQNTFD